MREKEVLTENNRNLLNDVFEVKNKNEQMKKNIYQYDECVKKMEKELSTHRFL